MSTSPSAQQGGSKPNAPQQSQQQQGQTDTPSQQQASTPVIRDWASI